MGDRGPESAVRIRPAAQSDHRGNTAYPQSPFDAGEIAETLSFAPQFEGRERVRSADSLMVEITAERLVRHLERSGFVLIQRAAGAALTTAGMLPSFGC